MTTPAPPYGAYPPPGAYAGYYGYPQPQPTNTLAIVSLVCAFLFAPLGIIFGHISLLQIKKTGEDGRGLAIAGLVISYLITVLTIVVVVARHRATNFTGLAKEGYFDNTKCHRPTTSTELGALQCGDPTGTGTGGPGYRFPNEYPTNQYRLTHPHATKLGPFPFPSLRVGQLAHCYLLGWVFM